MKIVKTNSEIASLLKNYTKIQSIGFVPTMGSLHQGHITLIERSIEECDITVCSIFINPTQFDSKNDFIDYPKNINADLLKLKKSNCDIVFIPEIRELYSKGEEAKEYDFGMLSKTMEGKFRIGHFNGMATIVEKLIKIIQPSKAFFGEKDLQQLQIVKELVRKMKISTKIIGVPTIREENGLAKSSRNKLLTKSQIKDAELIYDCLYFCIVNKNIGIKKLRSHILNNFNDKENIKLEYVEFVSIQTMNPIRKWCNEGESAICIAAYVNEVRLIDNIIL